MAAICENDKKKTKIQQQFLLLVVLCNALLSLDQISLAKRNKPSPLSRCAHSKRGYNRLYFWHSSRDSEFKFKKNLHINIELQCTLLKILCFIMSI